MQDLKVTSWQLFGHDRLYVNLPDGTAIGWADRGSGTITVLHPRYRDAVTDALARQVPDLPALVGEPFVGESFAGESFVGEEERTGLPAMPAPPAVPRIPPMRGMRKRAAVREPVREPVTAERPVPAIPPVSEPTAAEPLPEPVAAPGPVAAPEPVVARTAVPDAAPVAEPAAAPDPVVTPQPAPRHRPAALPALTPASDLAPRRPGAALREQLGESGAGALVRAATGVLRRHRDADPRRGALAGERSVGAELKRLTRHGWRVLHSVPLPDGTEIGHLLIGPGGVFAVSTEHRPGASVRIGDGAQRIDDGAPQPYELDGRAGARRAREALEAYCAFDVPVQTVLVFTGVTALEVAGTPAGVRVYRERGLSALAPLTGVLTATQVERVYDVARNAEAWLEA
ncbi:NERD domain-containing protein [Streptomyces sp. NPDC049944]|uniref:nuclease-related domain-containing protein n=2 Tax=unclassified Streptomyces TaxID=2593676 RepID=UPI003412C00C